MSVFLVSESTGVGEDTGTDDADRAVAAATEKIILCEKFKFNNFLCITTLMSMVTSKSVFAVRIHRSTKLSIKL